MEDKKFSPIDIDEMKIGEKKNFIVKFFFGKYAHVLSITKISENSFVIDKIPMTKEIMKEKIEVYEIDENTVELLLQKEEELQYFLEKLK